MTNAHFHASGKLLLTGEYAVLDGAIALALPTKAGQSLNFETGQDILHWQSFDADGHVWFEATLNPADDNPLLSCNDPIAGAMLAQILQVCQEHQPSFLPYGKVTTYLEFPRLWGLGSSATLIHMIAAWARLDPYILLAKTFGGSGYDIACAGAHGPILFQRNHEQANFLHIPFRPDFIHQLYFVYLGKKQNSREGIQRFRERHYPAGFIDDISALSIACAGASSIDDFNLALREHESIIASILGLPTIQSNQFSDFPGTIKSLGAWGGDFILVSSPYDDMANAEYFNRKGLHTVISYPDMIL